MNPQSGAGTGFTKQWTYNQLAPSSTISGAGTTGKSAAYNPQGGAAPTNLPNANMVQTTASPMNYVDPTSDGVVAGANWTAPAVDPAAQAAAAKAAADAAKAGQLRSEVTTLVNRIKDIFNSRYGQVDTSAGEQIGKLNDRYATESGDLASQITGENEQIGAASAASGVYDSSYRGNNVDTVTKAGQSQIRDLGQGLTEDVNKVGSWVSQQKAGFDAEKSGADTILSRLAESTDLNELTSIRSEIEGRINQLQASSADNNIASQNAASLASISPTNARSQKLKTTLSQIVAGNADSQQKAAIGQALITNSGLTAEEQQALLAGFQGDVSSIEQKPQV